VHYSHLPNRVKLTRRPIAANQVSQQMAMANGSGGGMMGPEQDPDKLEVLEHRWILEGIEDRLVAKLGA
jgi:hypothetical protein